MGLEAFTATEFNEIFSDITATSICESFPVFLNQLLPHLHTLKMGVELVPEATENLHILTWRSARENLIL
jgi:hypothetical protein